MKKLIPIIFILIACGNNYGNVMKETLKQFKNSHNENEKNI